MADAGQIKDLIERAAPVTVTGPGGNRWTGTLVGYCQSPAVVVDLGDGRHLTIAAEVVQVTERDVHRLAAPSPDALLGVLRRAAAKIAHAAGDQPADANERVAVALRLWHEDTAATMAETWQLLDQLMSTGVPLPTAWAGSTGDDDDRPEVYETLRLPGDPAGAALAWLTAWRTVLVYALTGEISDNGEPTHQALAAAAAAMPKKGTP